MKSASQQSESRPAIVEDPLPQAGDSLYEQMLDELTHGGMFWGSAAVIAFVTIGVEWIRYLYPAKQTLVGLIVLSVMCIGWIAFCIYKVSRALKRTKLIKLGIRGEMAVGQFLEANCRVLGYQVFHDIPATGSGGDFNIDHVLIGPAGVFSLETKNWSLPAKGIKARILFDPKSDRLTKPDGSFDISAAPQARANAAFLRDLLARLTGKPLRAIPVMGVLSLPGWWVDATGPTAEVSVLNTKMVPPFLRKSPRRLKDEEIALYAQVLATYVRNERKR